MVHQFGKELFLKKGEFGAYLLTLVLSYLAGMGILLVMMGVPGENESWFCLGTLLAGCFYVLLTLLLRALNFAGQFRTGLSMGRTRREFLIQTFFRYVLENSLAYALLFGGYFLEKSLYFKIFAEKGFELLPEFCFWQAAVFGLIGLPLLSMLMGVLYARFGKKAGWAMYVVWMFLVLMFPKFLETDSPDPGFLDRVAFRIIELFRAAPTAFLITAAAVILLGMGEAVWQLGKKVTVK